MRKYVLMKGRNRFYGWCEAHFVALTDEME
jgi:hypothetical protein